MCWDRPLYNGMHGVASLSHVCLYSRFAAAPRLSTYSSPIHDLSEPGTLLIRDGLRQHA